MTVGRMKRPWNVVGAGFNDDGVYFTFDDTTIHRGDVRLMEAAPDLLQALQTIQAKMSDFIKLANEVGINDADGFYLAAATGAEEQARAAISKALGEG
nr:MAG TPA: hypothetical protein [Caudoviricetes sp.]